MSLLQALTRTNSG